jgi:hypothetical protein
MGWSRGSTIFDDIIDSLIEADVDDEQRKLIYTKLIETFQDYDCDTLFECMKKDPIFDKVFKEIEDIDDSTYEDD